MLYNLKIIIYGQINNCYEDSKYYYLLFILINKNLFMLIFLCNPYLNKIKILKIVKKLKIKIINHSIILSNNHFLLKQLFHHLIQT